MIRTTIIDGSNAAAFLPKTDGIVSSDFDLMIRAELKNQRKQKKSEKKESGNS